MLEKGMQTDLDGFNTMAASLLRLLPQDDERPTILKANLSARLQCLVSYDLTSSVAYIACGSAMLDADVYAGTG